MVFDWKLNSVTINDLPIRDVKQSRRTALRVIDPFDLEHNLTKRVDDSDAEMALSKFKQALHHFQTLIGKYFESEIYNVFLNPSNFVLPEKDDSTG